MGLERGPVRRQRRKPDHLDETGCLEGWIVQALLQGDERRTPLLALLRLDLVEFHLAGLDGRLLRSPRQDACQASAAREEGRQTSRGKRAPDGHPRDSPDHGTNGATLEPL